MDRPIRSRWCLTAVVVLLATTLLCAWSGGWGVAQAGWCEPPVDVTPNPARFGDPLLSVWEAHADMPGTMDLLWVMESGDAGTATLTASNDTLFAQAYNRFLEVLDGIAK